MSKCIWIWQDDETCEPPFAIEWEGEQRERFSTFEAFCDNYKTGWGKVGESVRWAVSNGPHIEPLLADYKRGLETRA